MVETWILASGIVLVFAVLLLLPLLEATIPTTRREEIDCPFMDEKLSVAFVERSALGLTQPVDVRSCSAFSEPGHAPCDRECLALVREDERG